MKKLFISQPMKGKSDEDILAERQKAIKSAEEKIGEPVEVIDSFFQEAPVDAKPLWFLGKSLNFWLVLTLHTLLKAGRRPEDAKSRIHVLLSMAFRLSKTTQQSRKEVILLSPIHGLNGICPV